MNLAHAADIALASASPPGGAGGGPMGMLVQLAPMIAIFAIFYFLMIRPQQRQKADRQRMLEALKKGDRVITSSGLHGTVTGLN
ncbi:MAG: preprotein translocase subunit YajC [Candidatus Rokubacteria bacterium]|nr:preprotein translocase subunit YajC [Candidatus Rokubacteria bacterium]